MGVERQKKVQELIKTLSSKYPPADLLRQAAMELHIPLNMLMDDIARGIADGFLNGEYSWDFGFRAIERLHRIAYGPAQLYLPEFSWQVYLAFNKGPDSADIEPRTGVLLELIEKN